jgi:phospholipase/carboxylesterase
MSTAGRLTARPHVSYKSYVSGRTALGLDSARDAILLTPKSEPNLSLPLLVFLHGVGQSAEEMLDYLGTAPEETGVAVLAPNSRGKTWDAIGSDGFGPDVKFLNHALELVFEMLVIDARRVVLGGFSDGASYAISLALLNGDLFKGVMAFSPGVVIDGPWVGRPQFYLSHGKQDPIVPIKEARRIAADLNFRGYGVVLREFEGGHEIQPDILREGFDWMHSNSL